jgi:hypothetical protein
MIEKRFDDDWFIAYRHHLLERSDYALEERRPHTVHNIIHGARLAGAVDRNIDRDLRRLPLRHASAVRAHMQFYRACLMATGLVPADTLVNTAVQIEWFWYSTAFSAFYRDHLAHVMKVAAIGLFLLQDEGSPLADGSVPLVDSIARGMASGALGARALRAAARRCGNSAQTLRDPAFWRAAVIETVRLAGLLHDMGHPAVIASRMSRIAAPVRPIAPFEPTERDICRHTVSAFGCRLVASPFNRGELPDEKGLAPADAEACAAVFLHSHSLRAGYALVRLAEEADRIWQLSPFDGFVMEWAALAVSLHDYDKVFARCTSKRPEDEPVRGWLARDPKNIEAIRPRYASDPVSYILALSDSLQEFGRVLGPMDTQPLGADRTALTVRYPCRAVILRVERAPKDGARLTIELGPDDGTCFGATDWDYQRIKAHKESQGRGIFGEGGWLDSKGIFAGVSVEVLRAKTKTKKGGQPPSLAKPLKLFYSFADADEPLRKDLESHLAGLKWQEFICDWHHRKIGAGQELQREVDIHLEGADIVLLLISSDFLASDYCQGVELERALEMHKSGAARVVPILVRDVDWEYGPIADLRPLPSNRKPVESWDNQDEAWKDIAQGIREVVEAMRQARPVRR